MMVGANVRIAITRSERTAAGLRSLAGQSDDAAATRWLLALTLVLDGRKREDAARPAGMDWQALRDWVHRYNAGGMVGLAGRQGGDVAPRLSAEQETEVAGWIRTGPDLARDKVVQ